MVNFADLKKSRTNKFEELQTAVKQRQGFVNHDAKCWKPVLDKAGSAYVILRFLPAPTFLSEEETDFAKVDSFNVKMSHEGDTKPRYYIENSLRTLGKDDPANTLKWDLWNRGDVESKELSKKIKNRTQYYSNIYIEKETNAPQNEGKVFPYRYGQQVYEKIKNALTPEFPDDPTFNPFDLWEGRSFILKVKTDPAKKMPTYDASVFEERSKPLFEDDAKMEQVWLSCESVQQWVGDDRFLSYEALEKKIYKAVNLPLPSDAAAASNATATRSQSYEPTNTGFEIDPEPARESRPAAQAAQTAAADPSLDDDDAFLKQFE